MPRMRSVKPEFFTDADLCELSPLHRLLYQGLWCQADREGRLEDKPRDLKVRVLPFDQCDVEAILADLEREGFILRYVAGGKRYIWIPKFPEHQHPHVSEKPSTLPAPSADDLKRLEHGGDHVKTTPLNVLATPGAGTGAGTGAGKKMDPAPHVAAPPSSSPTQKHLLIIEAPATPEYGWTGEDFWRWAQSIRWRSRLVPEKWPNQSALSSWWSAARMVPGVSVEALKEGFYRFGESKHWEQADPPFPFRAFISEWRSFTRLEADDAAAAG
jgi:hypothetical protein